MITLRQGQGSAPSTTKVLNRAIIIKPRFLKNAVKLTSRPQCPGPALERDAVHKIHWLAGSTRDPAAQHDSQPPLQLPEILLVLVEALLVSYQVLVLVSRLCSNRPRRAMYSE